ncbi:rab-like protein 3 [Macrosteles quadrilineatus]|uniref:rab-like protein 3 n=1 Tax=Macrosteles quadrilineatus TaxID=74068 RepID=UPI0023E333D2|nr:rab-like protein 3 [Macrosteles quadrilineatus]
MAAIDKVKVIVVGDSGVGKTSLVHLVCHSEPISNPSWTVGCGVDVKLHEYEEGMPKQRSYFVELWDVGGSSSHRNARHVFYSSVHGIILVHDLTNRKSHQNLQKWLAEVLNREEGTKKEDFDPEHFVGATQIPILVVGTKSDLVAQIRNNNQPRSSFIAEECGADEIFLDCSQRRAFAAGTTNAVHMSRFFDKVIKLRYHTGATHGPFASSRRYSPYVSPPPTYTKLFHND